MTPVPAGTFESNDYAAKEDVQSRLYSGQGLVGATNPPTDTTRDALIASLITSTSRDFDKEVWGSHEYDGLFSWRLETRLYSGVGQQDLHIGPAVKIIKVEIDATPGQDAHSWQDFTVEFTQNRMGMKPIRGYPKQVLFRQSTFYVDPFRLGNVRLTGLWGIVQPNDAATPPNTDWETAFLTPIHTNDPTDHGSGPGIPTITSTRPEGGGWWTTPDDVRAAVASWTAHRFQAAKTGYGTTTGTGGSKFTSLKSVPDDVQRVINNYKSENQTPKLAMVADDGSDYDTSSGPAWRWSGWMTHN